EIPESLRQESKEIVQEWASHVGDTYEQPDNKEGQGFAFDNKNTKACTNGVHFYFHPQASIRKINVWKAPKATSAYQCLPPTEANMQKLMEEQKRLEETNQQENVEDQTKKLDHHAGVATASEEMSSKTPPPSRSLLSRLSWFLTSSLRRTEVEYSLNDPPDERKDKESSATSSKCCHRLPDDHSSNQVKSCGQEAACPSADHRGSPSPLLSSVETEAIILVDAEGIGDTKTGQDIDWQFDSFVTAISDTKIYNTKEIRLPREFFERLVAISNTAQAALGKMNNRASTTCMTTNVVVGDHEDAHNINTDSSAPSMKVDDIDVSAGDGSMIADTCGSSGTTVVVDTSSVLPGGANVGPQSAAATATQEGVEKCRAPGLLEAGGHLSFLCASANLLDTAEEPEDEASGASRLSELSGEAAPPCLGACAVLTRDSRCDDPSYWGDCADLQLSHDVKAVINSVQ
ncbi:unnamed protein product, partial [Amoebophrya sp. A25]